jgi:hypothetical protein
VPVRSPPGRKHHDLDARDDGGRRLVTGCSGNGERSKPAADSGRPGHAGQRGALSRRLDDYRHRLVGEAEDTNGKHPLGDMSKSASSLVVYYAFDYQGMPIDAVITLTPNDKTVDAVLDFANGAAQFVGTATKK